MVHRTPVFPLLVWRCRLVPALFLVPAVPTLLWDLVPTISGSGGSDSVVGPSSDSISGSGGSDSVMGPGSDSVSGSGPPVAGSALDLGSGPGSGLGFGLFPGFVTSLGLGSVCSGSVFGLDLGFGSILGPGFGLILAPALTLDSVLAFFLVLSLALALVLSFLAPLWDLLLALALALGLVLAFSLAPAPIPALALLVSTSFRDSVLFLSLVLAFLVSAPSLAFVLWILNLACGFDLEFGPDSLALTSWP